MAKAVASVAGFRCAADQELFLERYLDEAVEQAIGSVTTVPVTRAQIVEVGNLAGINSRSAMRQSGRAIDFSRTCVQRQCRRRFEDP